MDISIRDVLLMLSIRYKGDWKAMYQAIKRKDPYSGEEVKQAYEKTKAKFLTLSDEDYPRAFTNQCNPPFLLYYYGNIKLLKEKYILTAVGSRNPTLYQADTTYHLIKEVVQKSNREVVIVSGLAKGIDALAMRACIQEKGKVIGVIGSGIDNPYPSESQDIYEYCKTENGLILSEYPLDLEAKPENFVFRNRLLVAIGKCLFVGAGKNRSGTSASIRYAIDAGKEILALPCNISGDDLTNTLIRDGARSVLSSQDILDTIKEVAPFQL